MIYEKVLVSLSQTHGNWVGKLRRRGDRGENCVCWPEDGWIETSVHKPVPTLYFKNRLITSDSKLFLFRKYTNHLQVLFASVFTKRSWQAHTFWAYIKQGNERVWISVFLCGVATWAAEGGEPTVGWDASCGSGALGWSRAFHICTQNGSSGTDGVGGLFVGDNRPKSKTDGPLRGTGEPASELIKRLLCISEGTACLMSDTRRRILDAL